MKYCPQCGTQNVDEAAVCTNCGRAFAPSEATAKVAAAPAAPSVTLPTTLPIRLQTLVVAAAFVAGALVLLILSIVSLVGDDRSSTILLVRSINDNLINLFLFGIALYLGYLLIAHGLDLSKMFGAVPVWARWLLVLVAGYLIYFPVSLAATRLLRFINTRGAEAPFLAEQFFEGLLILIAMGIAYWRLSRHPNK